MPHMVRMLTGPDNRRLIPVCALAGGCLLLLADTVTRAVLSQEIPIGVITALIGGDAFFPVLLAWALLLLSADTLTRAVLPAEIPIGVLTALIGGPFFCIIYRRRQIQQIG